MLYIVSNHKHQHHQSKMQQQQAYYIYLFIYLFTYLFIYFLFISNCQSSPQQPQGTSNKRPASYASILLETVILVFHKLDRKSLPCREELPFSAVTHPVMRDRAIATWRGIPLWEHLASWLLKSWNKRGQLAYTLPFAPSCFCPFLLPSLLSTPPLPSPL